MQQWKAYRVHIAYTQFKNTLQRNKNRSLSSWNSLAGNISNIKRDALLLYSQARASTLPHTCTFLSALKDVESLQECRQIHAHIVVAGLHSERVLATTMVHVYGKLGRPKEARQVFDRIPVSDNVVYNAMISCFNRSGNERSALNLILHMIKSERFLPDSVTLFLALQSCSKLGNLHMGREIHTHVVLEGFGSDTFLGSCLVTMYSRCGDLESACCVFEGIHTKNRMLWNSMIVGYAQEGLHSKVIELFAKLHKEGIIPDNVAVESLMQACLRCGYVDVAERMHGFVIRKQLGSCPSVANFLMILHSKSGNVGYSRLVFDRLEEKNIVSWNVMINAYCDYKFPRDALIIFKAMQKLNVRLDSHTIVNLLQACTQLGHVKSGMEVHGYAIKSQLCIYSFVGNSLLTMYSRCGALDLGHRVFHRMPERNLVSWNSLIAGYLRCGEAKQSLVVFNQMLLENLIPDFFTVSTILSACSYLAFLNEGKAIHTYLIKHNIYDLYIGAGLVDMYAKCGTLEDAKFIFWKLPKRDVVAWNAILMGCCESGKGNETLSLFKKMQFENVTPDSVTVVSLLQACTLSRDLKRGSILHAYSIQSKLISNIFVKNSLMAMYAECKDIEMANQIFHENISKDVDSWNTMIMGYIQNGADKEALILFQRMQDVHIVPNLITIMSVLPAYGHLASLHQGQCLHSYIVKKGFEADIFVGSGLINMYSKCGSIGNAHSFFNKMPLKGIGSWNTLIAGYALQGHGQAAITLLSRMQQVGFKPDSITLLAILTACSHAGLVDEGREYFRNMTKDFGIAPEMEHYACMVDILGRAGHLDEALKLIKGMLIKPDANVWTTFLSAIRTHGSNNLGESVTEFLFDFKPENVGHLVLLSNIYAARGVWDKVSQIRKLIRERGMRKTPGYSWIELDGKVYNFSSAGHSTTQDLDNICYATDIGLEEEN